MAGPEDTTLPVEPFPTLPPEPVPAPSERVFTDAPDRLVFFFSGFDPKGATFYHRLFRSGIGQRNASHDETLAVGGRHRIDRWAAGWTALWRGAPHGGDRPVTMRTRVHFMRWDDIVRRHWKRSLRQVAADYWNVYLRGMIDGIFLRVWRKAPAAFWLALFPLGVALGSLLGAVALSWLGLAGIGLAPGWLAVLVGLAAGAAAWRWIVGRIDCEWLLRLYAFTRTQALGLLPALDARQDDMADHVVGAVESRLQQPGTAPLREILLVGYSTGSTLAVSVAARALDRLNELVVRVPASERPQLAIVTLGHCIPVAADWRGATRMRAELEALADCASLTWHDYSAPADWAAFWRTPPWPEPARLKGLQASPRFHAVLEEGEYRRLKRDRREMHLQYLRAPSRRVDTLAYDYFALVCGPWTLAERHSRQQQARDLRDRRP